MSEDMIGYMQKRDPESPWPKRVCAMLAVSALHGVVALVVWGYEQRFLTGAILSSMALMALYVWWWRLVFFVQWLVRR